MKLTKAQKEVIRKMREGKALHNGNGQCFIAYTTTTVHPDDFNALKNEGLIQANSYHIQTATYAHVLTELGKTIQL